jgi:hypothetical protein
MLVQNFALIPVPLLLGDTTRIAKNPIDRPDRAPLENF